MLTRTPLSSLPTRVPVLAVLMLAALCVIGCGDEESNDNQDTTTADTTGDTGGDTADTSDTPDDTDTADDMGDTAADATDTAEDTTTDATDTTSDMDDMDDMTDMTAPMCMDVATVTFTRVALEAGQPGNCPMLDAGMLNGMAGGRTPCEFTVSGTPPACSIDAMCTVGNGNASSMGSGSLTEGNMGAQGTLTFAISGTGGQVLMCTYEVQATFTR